MDTKVDLYIRLFVIFIVVYSRLPVNSFRMNTARTSRPHLSIAIPRMSSTVEDTNIYDSSSNLDSDGNPVKARMPLKIAVAGAGVGAFVYVGMGGGVGVGAGVNKFGLGVGAGDVKPEP